jgi:hypothetical protein
VLSRTPSGPEVDNRESRCQEITAPGSQGETACTVARQPLLAWNGSWNGSPENPSAKGAVIAIRRAICAGNACVACAHASRKSAVGTLRINGQRRVIPAVFAFQRNKLSATDQRRHSAEGRHGHVSGIIWALRANLTRPNLGASLGTSHPRPNVPLRTSAAGFVINAGLNRRLLRPEPRKVRISVAGQPHVLGGKDVRSAQCTAARLPLLLSESGVTSK